MDPMFHARMVSLLCNLFNIPALRRFIRSGEQGTAIALELPGPEASLHHVADIAVEQLFQRGLVTVTLNRLRIVFPDRTTGIAAVLPSGSPSLDEDTQVWRPTGVRRATIRAWQTEIKHGSASPRFVGACMVVNGVMEFAATVALLAIGQLPHTVFGISTSLQTAVEMAGLVVGASLWLWPRRVTIILAALYLMLTGSAYLLILLIRLEHVEVLLLTLCFKVPLILLLFNGAPGRRRADLLCLLLLLYATVVVSSLLGNSFEIGLTGRRIAW